MAKIGSQCESKIWEKIWNGAEQTIWEAVMNSPVSSIVDTFQWINNQAMQSDFRKKIKNLQNE